MGRLSNSVAIHGYNRAPTGLFEYVVFTFIMPQASVLIRKLGCFLSRICFVWTWVVLFVYHVILVWNNICCSSHSHWIFSNESCHDLMMLCVYGVGQTLLLWSIFLQYLHLLPWVIQSSYSFSSARLV